MSITDEQVYGEIFTLAEIEELYCDITNSNGGTLAAIVDGVRYETDWGYGIEGVMYFIEMLKRRHGLMPDQKKGDE